jgi:hypothetical protein
LAAIFTAKYWLPSETSGCRLFGQFILDAKSTPLHGPISQISGEKHATTGLHTLMGGNHRRGNRTLALATYATAKFMKKRPGPAGSLEKAGHNATVPLSHALKSQATFLFTLVGFYQNYFVF